jgi:phosphatidylglycerol:prolipoprotein diacylglycerol transferase
MLAALSYTPLVRIHLGPLAISPHGIAAMVGFLAGAMLARQGVLRAGLDERTYEALLTRFLVGGILGARAFYVLNHLDQFDSPLEWLRVWEGGLSLLGGVFGAIMLALPLLRRRDFRRWAALDALAPGLALGIAIGRVGDLVIADHLGRPTSSPLGFRCPDVAEVGRTVGSPCQPGEVVHLTALYDLAGALLLFAVLLLLSRRDVRAGTVTLAFALGYGLLRFVADFARADERLLLGLSGSQLTGLAVATGALVLLLRGRSDGGRSEAPSAEQGAEAGRGRDPGSGSERPA